MSGSEKSDINDEDSSFDFYDANDEDSEDFYDAEDGIKMNISSNNNSRRSMSKSNNNDKDDENYENDYNNYKIVNNSNEGYKQYTELSNLAGLASPNSLISSIDNNNNDNDELGSDKGSLISSLSSFSISEKNHGFGFESDSNINSRRSSGFTVTSNSLSIEAHDNQYNTKRKLIKKDINLNKNENYSNDNSLDNSSNDNNSNDNNNNNNTNNNNDIDINNNDININTIIDNLIRTKSNTTNIDSSSKSTDNFTLPQNINVNNIEKRKDDFYYKNIKKVQEIRVHEGAIWSMKISPDGRYLCTGGQDTVVIVWNIGKRMGLNDFSFESSGNNNDSDNNSNDSASLNDEDMLGDSRDSEDGIENEGTDDDTNNGIICPRPYKRFRGHSKDVIDIAWSRSNFILSASTDKTVRLWHVTREDCLQFFRHPDIVTSVDFHPSHDRYFVSGCFDRRLRLWDIIPDGNVISWGFANEVITAVSFDPNGSTVAGGLINGEVIFFDYDQGMKFITQMGCRNKRGKYKQGSKVTGLTFLKKELNLDVSDNNARNRNSIMRRNKGKLFQNCQLLVTTNDSRIRLCQLDDYSLVNKYKGIKNKSMQIKASLSECGKWVICGSENGTVNIWNVNYDPPFSIKKLLSKKNRNSSLESFSATNKDDCATTGVLFMPSESLRNMIRADKYDSLKKLSISEKNQVINNLEIDDLCSRIIVTADYDGVISAFCRYK